MILRNEVQYMNLLSNVTLICFKQKIPIYMYLQTHLNLYRFIPTCTSMFLLCYHDNLK